MSRRRNTSRKSRKTEFENLALQSLLTIGLAVGSRAPSIFNFATMFNIFEDFFYFTFRGHSKKRVKRWAGNLPTPHLEDMLAEIEHNTPRWVGAIFLGHSKDDFWIAGFPDPALFISDPDPTSANFDETKIAWNLLSTHWVLSIFLGQQIKLGF